MNMSGGEARPNGTDDYIQVMDLPVFLENPEEMLEPMRINSAFLPIILTHSITFLVGLAGNSAVIATWAGGTRSSRSPTCSFLVSLAVADLLLLVIHAPLETLYYFVVSWDAGGAICKLQNYVEMLSGMASVLNLVAVSFERFLVILFPMRARRLCTLSNCRRGLVVVWVMAFLLSVPVLGTKQIKPMTYHNNVSNITVYYCFDSDSEWAFVVAVYQLSAMFVIPALLMSFCYTCVIRELWTSTKTMAAMTRANQTHKGFYRKPQVVRFCPTRHQRTPTGQVTTPTTHAQGNKQPGLNVGQARKQVIKMLLLVIVLFLVCWGPRLFMNVAIKAGLNSFDMTAYSSRVAFYLLSFIHSALNPFVYGLMSSNFRRLMMQSCSRHCGICSCPTNQRFYESEVREFSTYISSVRRSKQYGSCQTEVRLSKKAMEAAATTDNADKCAV